MYISQHKPFMDQKAEIKICYLNKSASKYRYHFTTQIPVSKIIICVYLNILHSQKMNDFRLAQ